MYLLTDCELDEIEIVDENWKPHGYSQVRGNEHVISDKKLIESEDRCKMLF